jgi:hypothetical protein
LPIRAPLKDNNAGADPGFQVEGGWGALKKNCAKFFGVFRVKNHDFTPKNHILPIFGGRPPPWIRPCNVYTTIQKQKMVKKIFN